MKNNTVKENDTATSRNRAAKSRKRATKRRKHSPTSFTVAWQGSYTAVSNEVGRTAGRKHSI